MPRTVSSCSAFTGNILHRYINSLDNDVNTISRKIQTSQLMRFLSLMRLDQAETRDKEGEQENQDDKANLELQATLGLLESLAILVHQARSLIFSPFWNKFSNHKEEKKDQHLIHSRTCKLKLDP